MSYLKEKQIRDRNNFLTDVISICTICLWQSLLVFIFSDFIAVFSFPLLSLRKALVCMVERRQGDSVLPINVPETEGKVPSERRSSS